MTPDNEAYSEFTQSVVSRWSDKPDGRPSTLYLVRGGWFSAEILVDSKTSEVYCSVPPILSMKGWEFSRVEKWCEARGWKIENLGSGTKVETLQSK